MSIAFIRRLDTFAVRLECRHLDLLISAACVCLRDDDFLGGWGLNNESLPANYAVGVQNNSGSQRLHPQPAKAAGLAGPLPFAEHP
ncbi:MAG: hypothetical protein H6822_14520 [Planctomycetaceae bacterium]|nr:hypothetical protein [Planctomycetaceae bacterium]